MTRNRLDEEETSEMNPYEMVILNKVCKDDIKTEQILDWSILSDVIKYIDRNLDMAPSLTVKPLDYRQHERSYHSLKIGKGLTVEIGFEGDKLKGEYFDRYDGIYTEVSQVTRFDDSTDLITKYLGRRHNQKYDNQSRRKFPNFWTWVHKWKNARKYRM